VQKFSKIFLPMGEIYPSPAGRKIESLPMGELRPLAGFWFYKESQKPLLNPSTSQTRFGMLM
jgi:hypothetical protein